jgi:ferritin heavy chain
VEKRLLENLERLETLLDKSGDDLLTYALHAKFLCKASRKVKVLEDVLQ